MKKKEKNRIRKSTKYLCLFIATVLLIISFVSLILNIFKENIRIENREIYNYKNKFNYDYNIDLKKNKYFKEKNISDKTLSYITQLIDKINVNFNYDYEGSKESDLKCTYSIKSRLFVTYPRDGKEEKILEEEEILIKEKCINRKSNGINLKENLKLDLKNKNNTIEELSTNMGIILEAKYFVILDVKVETEVDGEHVKSEYHPKIEMDLAKKTTKIIGENNLEESQYISKEFKLNKKNNVVAIIISIITFIISLLIYRFIARSTTINRVKNEFRIELNKILKMCQDKIVQVNTKPNDKDEQEIVYVKDFGEIIKISDELFKPILYYYDIEKDEAMFSIITENSKYRYILKNKL